MFKRYPLFFLPIRNGLLGGLLGMALMLGLYFMGRHPFLIPVFLDFRVILISVLLYFTLREFRDIYREGVLSFWEGMIMSLLLTAAFALIAFLLVWAFGTWHKVFLDSYISLTLEQIKTIPAEIVEKIGKPELERNIKALPNTRAIDLAGLYFSQTFIISFFLSVIISLILRRQPKLS